jgi:EmrB/QacA subfamily drug resistance transporter
MAHLSDGKTSNKIILLVITMGSFMTPFMGSAVNIALPSIGTEFAMDAVSLAWVATSYLLAATVFILPFGRAADIYGRKKIFTYGIIIFTASSVLSALSVSAVMLIISRVLQGIGGAMTFGTSVAILTSVFPANERGKALGINVAAVYVGLSLGPFLGGLLTQYAGWRSIFWLNLPMGLIIITYLFWKLKGEWAEAKGEKFDLSGSVIYGLAVIALIYGLSLLPELSGAVVISGGVVGMLLFIRWEMKAASPVMHMDLFRHNRVFAFSNLAVLVSYSATFAVAFLLSLYLQYVKGFSPQNAGLILVAMPTVQAIFSPYAGRLSDRISPQILASAGMALTTAGLGLLVFLNQDTGVGFIVVSLIVLGAGFALFSSPNTNAIMSSVDKRSYGVASATIGTMRQFGMMLSMGIAMLLLSVYIGRVEITPEHYAAFTSSLKTAFLIFAVFCFGGIFASLARGKAAGSAEQSMLK